MSKTIVGGALAALGVQILASAIKTDPLAMRGFLIFAGNILLLVGLDLRYEAKGGKRT